MKYCNNCGSQLEDDAKFCIYCGTEQKSNYDDIEEIVRKDENTTKKTAQHNDLVRLIIIVSMLLIVGFTIFCVISHSSNSYTAKNVLENYGDVDDINENESDFDDDVYETQSVEEMSEISDDDLGTFDNPIELNTTFEIDYIDNYNEFSNLSDKPSRTRLSITPIEMYDKVIKFKINIIYSESSYVWLDAFNCSVGDNYAIGFYNVDDLEADEADYISGGEEGDEVEGYMIFYEQFYENTDMSRVAFNYVAYDETYSTINDVMDTEDMFNTIFLDLTDGNIDYSDIYEDDAEDYYNDIPVYYIEASSQLEDDKYTIYNLLDDDMSTSWSEGVYGIGKGETITIHFEELQKVSGFYIYNGYLKDWDVYFKNGRVKEITADFGNGKEVTQELNYVTEGKEISINEDLVEYNITDIDIGETIETDKITITIKDAISGDKYDDTCISEIKLY